MHLVILSIKNDAPHQCIIMERCVYLSSLWTEFCSGHFSPHIRVLGDILSSVLLRRRRWQQRIDNEAEIKRSRRSAPEAWRSSSDPFFWTLAFLCKAFSAWESRRLQLLPDEGKNERRKDASLPRNRCSDETDVIDIHSITKYEGSSTVL